MIHTTSSGTYGSPRVHAVLRAHGRRIGHVRIEKLMRRAGIRGLAALPRRTRTTDSRHDDLIAPDLLDRNLTTTLPNQVWLAEWLIKVGIKSIRIYPGSPWENGYNEGFNGTLRRGLLNAEWFVITSQAQTVINQWLKQYNQIRPHQAIYKRPPAPETILENPKSAVHNNGARHVCYRFYLC